jgi:hypothetical protein
MAIFPSWILMFTGDLMAPLDIRVYRKPTHTNLYLNAKSHHHPANNLDVLSTLSYRTKAICDSDSLPHKLNFLHNTFLNNGYIQRFLYPNTMSRQWVSCQESSLQFSSVHQGQHGPNNARYIQQSLTLYPARSPPSLSPAWRLPIGLDHFPALLVSDWPTPSFFSSSPSTTQHCHSEI